MGSLYSLSARYAQLLDLDELSEEDCAELESLHDNLEDSFIDRAKYIKNLEADRCAVIEAINDMQYRANKLKDKVKKHREILAVLMLENNLDHITKSPLFALKAKYNPVSVDGYDTDQIPEDYWYETNPKPVKKIDKKAIKIAIETGIDVPGAVLTRTLKLEIK